MSFAVRNLPEWVLNGFKIRFGLWWLGFPGRFWASHANHRGSSLGEGSCQEVLMVVVVLVHVVVLVFLVLIPLVLGLIVVVAE